MPPMPLSAACTVTSRKNSHEHRSAQLRRAGPPRPPVMRWLWFGLGWIMVALGVIGALLPVMPTTIFLILAVGCSSILVTAHRCACGASRARSAARARPLPAQAWRSASSCSAGARIRPGRCCSASACSSPPARPMCCHGPRRGHRPRRIARRSAERAVRPALISTASPPIFLPPLPASGPVTRRDALTDDSAHDPAHRSSCHRGGAAA